jgi:hypothetical protein
MSESSVLASLSGSLTISMNEVLRWVYWWHSTEESPSDIGPEQIHYELSADFDTSLMDAEDVQGPRRSVADGSDQPGYVAAQFPSGRDFAA